MFAKHRDSDVDVKNKELKEALEKMNDPGIDLNKRRIALSCGHDRYHLKCIKKWINISKMKNCPVCRLAITNLD